MPKQQLQDTAELQTAAQARELRHSLERFHGLQNPSAVQSAWPHLDSDDPLIRAAARLAIESQPTTEWQTKALTETRTNASLTALLALARCGRQRKPRHYCSTGWPTGRYEA